MSNSMEYLFSYGTLQEKEIQKELYKRILKGEVDILPNFTLAKVEVNGEPYPIVRKRRGTKVAGTLYALTPEEIKNTDEYEDRMYTRAKVKLASGKKAWAYIKS